MIDQKKIHNQCLSDDPEERIKAIEQLRINSSSLPDKQQACDDLRILTNDEDSYVRSKAVPAYSFFFSYIPDKQQVWSDLHRLTNDKDRYVRSWSAASIGYLFSRLPDKQLAWRDLHRLIDDDDSFVRSWATCALEVVFPYVPDKEQAWDDLHRLTEDEESSVKFWAGYVLGCVFSHIPNKELGWRDLYRLIKDEDCFVSSRACWILGSVYSDVPDQEQAYDALYRLINDHYANVRAYANNSLGKISIFKASQAKKEEDYKNELEKAIIFFNKADQESRPSSRNPAQFCLPFYRSFHAIIFEKQEATEEVDKYLEEAKNAVKGSRSKELLFEAIKNLANALKEVQNLENLDFEAKKSKLDFYRKYCDRAAELIRETEESTPYAIEVFRKGLPIFDRNLKELIEDIQEKARTAYRESIKTATEEIAYSICREVQEWEISSQEEMTCNVENLTFTLECNFPKIPENQDIFNKIQQIKEQKDVAKQIAIISTIIPLIPKVYMEPKIDEIKNDIREINKKMDCLIIYMEPGIREEVEISVGTEFLGTGAKHIINIPLQEISYSELKEDLGKITGTKINELSKLPEKLANKVKGYLLLHGKKDVLEKLTESF